MKLIQQNHISWIRVFCVAIAILTLIKVWVGPITTTQEALAQIPDGGTQRKHLLDQTKRTNQLLEQIKQILKHDTLKVQWEGADNPSADN